MEEDVLPLRLQKMMRALRKLSSDFITIIIRILLSRFPLSEAQIVGEQNQKDFIALFGAILRMRNLLLSFDEFKENELISERDLQDYH